MKKSRFIEEQMVAILREADRTSGPEISKKHNVSEQGIQVWGRKFGASEPADVKRLYALELKKLLAERDLEIDVMKDINRRKW